MGEQSDEMIVAALVRSLTPEKRKALAGVMELVDSEEAFRCF